MTAGHASSEGLVLVCGVGAFGQAVLSRLQSFAVNLQLIDLVQPDWRNLELQQELQGSLTLGDMRKPHVLRQAGAGHARAVLLLSSDGGTNIEAALQVRLLNSTADIVIRSSRGLNSLGNLLQQRLPKLAVVDPLELSAGALVQALRPGPQLARFQVHDESFEVREAPLEDQRYQRQVRLEGDGHGGGDGRSLVVMPLAFYTPQTKARPAASGAWHHPWRRVQGQAGRALRHLTGWVRRRDKDQQTLLIGVLLMVLAGIPLFGAQGGWVRGLFVTAALLKGEYVDPTNVVLAESGGPDHQHGPLVGLTLAYSLVGTLLTSLLVAMILDRWLVSRLGMRRVGRLERRCEPILLVSGGPLARQVAGLLGRERHRIVRVESDETEQRNDANSVFVANRMQAVSLLRGRDVRAVALLSGQLLTDLQDTLELQSRWPEARFALLARGEGSEEALGHLLGGASLISPLEIGADVAVATAFGERVEGVWRVRGENLLQVRYVVSEGDGLVGRTRTRLEHGYGLTVLCLLRRRDPRPQAMPAPGTVLIAGDQLVVLATLAALRRVELGRSQPEGWLLVLSLPYPLTAERRLIVQHCLVRHLGMTAEEAARGLQGGAEICIPVDPDSGALVERDLQHQGVRVQIKTRFRAVAEADGTSSAPGSRGQH
ncbi:MAG: NAD-binding protein [Synechococcaceae cyanobacterium]|nr:NAD-binding protein [Synechococcaceae cyanobacterium]